MCTRVQLLSAVFQFAESPAQMSCSSQFIITISHMVATATTANTTAATHPPIDHELSSCIVCPRHCVPVGVRVRLKATFGVWSYSDLSTSSSSVCTPCINLFSWPECGITHRCLYPQDVRGFLLQRSRNYVPYWMSYRMIWTFITPTRIRVLGPSRRSSALLTSISSVSCKV